jgi:hypothetical protein
VKDGRWVTIAESEFDHEKRGLEAIKKILPDAEPFRAWANFEFRDNRGRWHEVDSPLLLARRKAQYLSSLLKDAIRERGGRTPCSPPRCHPNWPSAPLRHGLVTSHMRVTSWPRSGRS